MGIRFEKVDYIYQPHSPFEHHVLKDINVTIPSKSYTAIVGHTGSGKSTLIQHLNGLKIPTHGTVWIDDFPVTAEGIGKIGKALRKKVGIVFQFPESQLFEETVEKDIAFGPKNFGASEEEALKKAAEILPLVGLEPPLLKRSPFDLSGGQMRRVAIAGVLAMEPEILVLDEPTAGLDPQGRREMMEMFYHLYQQKHLTIVLVTHQMDDVAHYANHVIVIEKGQIAFAGTPQEVFKNVDWLEKIQLGLPTATHFATTLIKKGFPEENFSLLPLTLEALADEIAAGYERKKVGDADE
ncbi:energy-coupling factor ABC transporter ATP-binding protein [Allofustis seminis]|uniref:energy-coupling factor ABC transporter ATP-binding protein n=1 Tax=Allofustis seminis TaxID=166939 RepID=UPI00047776DD|nr:energy-coupling factor ABC transporter ATP-binding protein [Allofustis seminis]